MIRALGLLAILAAAATPAVAADDAAAEAFFESKIRPVLATSCVRCHGPKKASGGLRLDSRAGLLRGGAAGPAVEPDRPEESRLLRAIRRVDADDVAPMPPDKPLAAGAVADLRRWVDAGLPWPAGDGGAPIRTDRHWAFEPVRAVDPPGAAGSHPIDAFLTADQRKRGLTPVPPADKATLIRRATFDLIGLPPTPEEVDAFLADAAPTAFAAVLDRLLASPHHGAKWGRAWLDVAHYADTAGETADLPVPDAWRYRNYVIAAINADKPYDRFLREQVAGDLLARDLPADAPPGRFAELVTATGYLAVARRFGFEIAKDHPLTIDDTIDTFGRGVLGLTVACARCHDHKYDPISATDYYALYGIFATTRYPYPGCEKNPRPRDNVPLLSPAEADRRLGPSRAAIAAREAALATVEERIRQAAAPPARGLAAGDLANGGKQDFGGPDAVSVRKGEMIRLTVAPKANHGADSTLVELKITERGGAARTWDVTRDVLADPFQGGTGYRHDDGHGNRGVWQVWDGSATPRLLTAFLKDAEGTKGLLGWRGAGPTPFLYANTNEQLTPFSTVRHPARSLSLHPGPTGAAVLAWESPIEGTVAIAGRVEDIDVTSGDGIGWTLDLGPATGPALAEAAGALQALAAARGELEAAAASVPQGYAVAEGTPHDERIQLKGDPETLGAAVPRRFLEVLGGQVVTPGAGSGRRDLADWIADPRNPLTPRVIVNRVWQGHFGAGLVRTPDNFGVRGEPPTHPELLDWLTARFVAEGWSLKSLHRLIMTSAAYQRAAADDAADARIDPDNLARWRFARRRLTAEEIRDALLAAGGDLDATPGGPHPFPAPPTWAFTQHNPFIAVYDHERRGVYLMTQRIRRHPFLALFDGADPNSCTGRRDSTTVPTQALFYLNDPFVHARAAGLAARLAPLPGDAERLDRASRLLFGRPPRPEEAAIAGRFLATYAAGGLPEVERRKAAWAGWLRVMFASNAFAYID